MPIIAQGRMYLLVSALLVAVSIAAAFCAGRFVGESDAKAKSEVALQYIEGSDSGAVLTVLTNAIERLRKDRIHEADLILTDYAKIRLAKVNACSKSAACATLAGDLLKSSAQFDRVQGIPQR